MSIQNIPRVVEPLLKGRYSIYFPSFPNENGAWQLHLAGAQTTPSNLLTATFQAFQASIMDGFAVRSSDGLGTFPVDAEQFAGDDVGPLQPGGIQWLSNGFRQEMPRRRIDKASSVRSHL